MPQKKKNLTDETTFKFLLPCELKDDLERLAEERSLSVSALLRLIVSEYVRNKG
jgi:predicted transcriptional regulator